MIRLHRFAALTGMLLAASCAPAANISFTGTFVNDTDVQLFTFTLLAPTPNVALRTWSYTGGTNAAGQVIPGGGFEPILNLYESDGTQMNPGNGGPCTIPLTGNPLSDLTPDPATGACGDVYYPTTESFPGGVWSPGTYFVVLTENANPGVGNLSDGFFASVVLGLPAHSNFTCMSGAPGFQGSPPSLPVTGAFCDEWAPWVQRTGAWSLDILNVDSATQSTTTPEPGSFAIALAGIAVLGRRLRRRA